MDLIFYMKINLTLKSNKQKPSHKSFKITYIFFFFFFLNVQAYFISKKKTNKK